ncbi:MAG: enoyl-CoA hydratase [Acidobacteria bacterium]|nr:enoyl-CoA hydratase [Acidobacteriota bacterium]
MNEILLERASGIATITLNRPDKLNSFAGTMREELIAVLDEVADDETLRVVVITGAGRAFCAGGDVEYMSGLQKSGDVATFRGLLEAGGEIVGRLRAMRHLVIASVNGTAAGAGCNLALASDYRIASDGAKFAQSFTKIGLHPDWGGTWFLPRLVGRGRAMELMMTGRAVDAREALELGMVDRVVPHESLASETAAFARTIANGPRIAIEGIKRAVHASEWQSLADQLSMEIEHQLASFTSDEAAEGIAAFFEKRPQKFES